MQTIHLSLEEAQKDLVALADKVASSGCTVIIQDKQGNVLKLELAARPTRTVNGRFVYAYKDAESLGVAPP